MTDRKKVIKGLEYCKHTDGVECPNCPYWHEDDCVEILHADTLAMLKEQEAEISRISNAYLELVGKASKQPKVVRCKDCKHRGDSKKCVLAAISAEKDFPLFMLDNRGDWFCADGQRKTACDGCENKGSEDCALGKPGSENAYRPNGKLR